MAYYKLVSGGAVLDAVSDETARWIVENRNNYSTYVGEKEEAYGVLSTDGQNVYHISGKPAFHDFPDYVTVTMEEIGEGECRRIQEEISAGMILIEEADAEPEEEEQDPATAPKTRLRELEEEVASLREENQMLTECILEISEIIYA